MAKKFILFSKESSSMVSTWTDTIYCSILKNKSLASVLIEINRNREEDLEITTILEENGFKYDFNSYNDSIGESKRK